MSALREIIAAFGVEFDKEGNLKKGEKQIAGVTSMLNGLGKAAFAAGVAFLGHEAIHYVGDILQQADALAKQSVMLGVSAEKLQGWQHAAQLSGSSAEEFTAALTKFSKNVAEAGDNAAGPVAEAFKALGVSAKDAAGNLRDPLDVVDDVVVGLGGLHDNARRTQVAMALFGKSGASLLPLFNEGSEGIAKLRGEVKELGAGFDDAFLANAQEFNDNMDRVSLGFEGLAVQLIGPLLPALTELSKAAVDFAKSLLGGLSGESVLADIGHALVNILHAFTGLNKNTKFFSKAADGAGALYRALDPVYNALLDVEDLLVFLGGGKSLLGKRLDQFFGAGTQEKIRGFFEEIQSGFGNAIKMAVDLASSGQLLGIELAREAENISAEFRMAAALAEHAFGDAFNGIVNGAAQLVVSLAQAIKQLPGGDALAAQLASGAVGIQGHLFNAGEDPAAVAAEHRAKQLGFDASEQALATKQHAGGTDANAGAAALAQANAFLSLAQAMHPGVASAPAYAQGNTKTTNNNITAPTTVNVTVAPGTPAEIGHRLGKAGKDAAQINTRAIMAALVPTPGG